MPALGESLRAAIAQRLMPRASPEFTLVHAPAVQLLSAILPPEAIVFHCANGSKRSKAEAGKLKAMGVLPGIPDLFILWSGRLHGIEFKAGRGSVSKAQRELWVKMAEQGCPVCVCRCIEDVVSAVASWGIPMRGRLT